MPSGGLGKSLEGVYGNLGGIFMGLIRFGRLVGFIGLVGFVGPISFGGGLRIDRGGVLDVIFLRMGVGRGDSFCADRLFLGRDE